MYEWQPIDTAPKDGTQILAMGVYNSPWQQCGTRSHVIVAWDDYQNMWRSDAGLWEPQHIVAWRPLPPLPQGKLV